MPADGEPLQVVCGAPNARAGLIGVLGLPARWFPPTAWS
jgi:phenylalanyl-tRNA synthetase beta chain